MDQQKLRTTTTMWAGLATTTITALVVLVLCATGLPDAATVPVLAVLLATMVAGVVTDVLVRRRWRRTTREQRRWLSGLDEDLPLYRARVEERERTLYGVESRWYRPLGTVFVVSLGAALVPFNLLMPLAPDAPVDQLVTGWVTVTMLLTLALVVRTFQAAREDSRGLVFPKAAPAPAQAPADAPTTGPTAEELRQESIEKYLVVEEEVSPEVRLAHEIERLTRLLDDPDMPRPTIPVPAEWMEEEPAPSEPAEAIPPVVETPAPEVDVEAEAQVEAPTEEAESAPAEEAETPPADERRPESELSKLSKFFHAA